MRTRLLRIALEFVPDELYRAAISDASERFETWLTYYRSESMNGACGKLVKSFLDDPESRLGQCLDSWLSQPVTPSGSDAQADFEVITKELNESLLMPVWVIPYNPDIPEQLARGAVAFSKVFSLYRGLKKLARALQIQGRRAESVSAWCTLLRYTACFQDDILYDEVHLHLHLTMVSASISELLDSGLFTSPRPDEDWLKLAESLNSFSLSDELLKRAYFDQTLFGQSLLKPLLNGTLAKYLPPFRYLLLRELRIFSRQMYSRYRESYRLRTDLESQPANSSVWKFIKGQDPLFLPVSKLPVYKQDLDCISATVYLAKLLCVMAHEMTSDVPKAEELKRIGMLAMYPTSLAVTSSGMEIKVTLPDLPSTFSPQFGNEFETVIEGPTS